MEGYTCIYYNPFCIYILRKGPVHTGKTPGDPDGQSTTGCPCWWIRGSAITTLLIWMLSFTDMGGNKTCAAQAPLILACETGVKDSNLHSCCCWSRESNTKRSCQRHQLKHHVQSAVVRDWSSSEFCRLCGVDAVPLLTQCPVHYLSVARCACLSPPLTESQSPPRPMSHRRTELQSHGSPWSRSCLWRQSRCMSQQQRPSRGREWTMWARRGALPPAPRLRG